MKCYLCGQVNDVVIVYDQQKQKPRGMSDGLRPVVVVGLQCVTML